MSVPKFDGLVSEHPAFGDGLPREYLNFLQQYDPIKLWSDVVPLSEPLIPPNQLEWELDPETLGKLIHLAPLLNARLSESHFVNSIAPYVGLRYAYSRSVQHASVLRFVEEWIYQRQEYPSMIIEPGCFTGGLIHFLSKRFDSVPCLGFDIAPAPLRVCRHLEKVVESEGELVLLEGDFSQFVSEFLPCSLLDKVSGSLILMCNVIESLSNGYQLCPGIDPWTVKAGIISYWVSQGATVVLCERHDDPLSLVQTLVEHGMWMTPGCKVNLLDDFEGPTTFCLTKEEPLGRWEEARICTIGFFPSYGSGEIEQASRAAV